MSATGELISQAAAALPLANLLFSGAGRGGALVRRLAGRAATWCERRADLRRLARMSDRDWPTPG